MRAALSLCLPVIALLPVSSVAQSAPPAGQVLSLVEDIHTGSTPVSSEVYGAAFGNDASASRSFVQVGGHWYFLANTNATGEELHRTDGTPLGTTLVKDILPGPLGSDIHDLTAHAGMLYFYADDGTHGRELWSSDGTPAGTQLVHDIRPGSDGCDGVQITSWNGKLYLGADDGVHGRELWTSDGTSGGTSLVVDIFAGPESGDPFHMQASPNGTELLFNGTTAAEGRELWATDGTPGGTHLVLDIAPGPNNGWPEQLVAWNGRVLFRANDGSYPTDLWSTDGTTGGTTRVYEFPAPHFFAVDLEHNAEFGGELYFSADDGDGMEPWKTDGTPQGTVQVASITTSDPLTWSSPADFIVFDGALYFTADDQQPFGLGRELYRLSSSGQLTVVTDLQPGGLDSFASGGAHFIEFNGQLLFEVETPQGFELGVSDGTTAGTQLLADIAPGGDSSHPAWFTPIGPNTLLFAAENDALGRELWVTDGTTQGTQLFTEIDAGFTTADSFPADFVSVADGQLFFSATDSVHGKEPWVWDANAGATLLRDVEVGAFGSIDSLGGEFTSAWIDGDHGVYFVADGGLWVTDGTTLGTQLVKDVEAGGPGGINGGLAYFDNRLYFTANDGTHGVELWVSDGTETGTFMLRDIRPGSASSLPQEFVVMNGELFFSANNGFKGQELWTTDGTAPGTKLLADINVGGGGSAPRDILVFRDRLVFTASSQTWTSDGTTAGTTVLPGVIPNVGSLTPRYTPVGDQLFFRGTSIGPGYELWVTDLTAAGTHLVKDISPDSAGSPLLLGEANGRLYFSVDDGVHGRELWSSDGTSAGTEMVIDLHPAGSSSPFEFQRVSNGFYFAATTPTHGRELFYSDGTAEGTTLAAEIFPGATGSDPVDLALADGRLFFQATHPVFGRELHMLAPAGATSRSLGHSNGGALLSTNDPVLGAPFTVSLDDVPLSAVANVLMWSLPVDAPSGLGFDPGNALWLDAGSLHILALLPPGDYDVGGTLPSDPLYEGIKVTLQNVALQPLATSNAVSLVFSS